MRYLSLFLILGVWVLTACASGAAVTPESTTEPRTLSSVLATGEAEVEAETAAPGESGSGNQPSVAEETTDGSWNLVPEAVVIQATHCCGFTPEFVALNYIPAATVWGDGRIVWSQFIEGGGRQVLEGQLSQAQMGAYLEKAEQSGFFGWKELYTDPMSPSDLPTQCLTINLAETSKKVCEYYQGAPQAFHDLYDEIAAGMGLDGQPYRPEKAFLIAYPTGAPEAEVPAWDAGAAGFSLEEATDGRWVEGPALEEAWDLANRTAWGGVFLDGDAYYNLSLQIPGLSMAEPPLP